MKRIKTIIVIVVLIVVAAVTVYFCLIKERDSIITSEPARIVDVSQLDDLCSVEILSDIPVKGSIGTRNFFARQTIKGSISFPLDSLSIDADTDTIRLFLPPEKVQFLESTAANSFRVIDVWNTNIFGSSTLNNNEENYIKQKAIDNATSRLYLDGTVSKARSEACSQLESLLCITLNRPVVVSDTTPKGFFYRNATIVASK